MTAHQEEEHEEHPKAKLLVYGFATIALVSSTLAALLVLKLSSSLALSSATMAGALRAWYGVAGGRRGINRAVGDGTLSLQPLLPSNKEKSENTVTVCLLSDTHNLHARVQVPEADVLVHCGDLTLSGKARELHLFCDWLELQPHKHKVVVAGNHDFCLVDSKEGKEDNAAAKQRLRSLCTLLENEEAVVCGLRVYGSPQTPQIPRRRPMAFQEPHSEALKPFWDCIPAGLDLLITHGPPKGYGDRILLGMQVGCPELLRAVQAQTPRFHAFGHIHEGYGTYPTPSTLFVNCSTCNTLYDAIHPPVVVEIQRRGL